MVIELIRWLDSRIMSGWVSVSHLEDTGNAMCTSVGTVIAEDDERIVIAGTWSTEDDEEIDSAPDAMVIPKVAIVSRQEYELL